MTREWKYPNSKFICEKQILIKQTNIFGNTYFSNFIEWQGEAREKFLLEHPNSEQFLRENTTLRLVTHSLQHTFKNNAYLGDRIRIEVTSKNILKYSFLLNFKYFNIKNELLIGEGMQKIGFYDEKLKGLCAVPQFFLDLIIPVLNQ
ncbi:MAG: hypothetical protein H6757_06655 [Candidatus Omnitrophica bacterium]|nr:hypothetical protein [Candidatus Omnitrophota bacterium]